MHLGVMAVAGNPAENFALALEQPGMISLAQPRRRFQSVSSTACRSKVERLMTLSTLAVAVCCWSDLVKSSVR